MSIYGIDEAQGELAKLIDLALQGERVIISKNGEAVELIPIRSAARSTSHAQLAAERATLGPSYQGSVALFAELYDEPDL